MAETVVHQIPAGWGGPSSGPFCLKLPTCLRIVNVPYRTVVDGTSVQASCQGRVEEPYRSRDLSRADPGAIFRPEDYSDLNPTLR